MKQTHSNEHIAQICARLGHLVHGGVALNQCGSLLGGPLGEGLDAGLPCADALEAAGFPRAVTAMVRIGEESGQLEDALFSLAKYHEQKHRTAKLLQNSLSYPAMTLGLMLMVVGVLLVKVLPIFDGVYQSLGSRLTGVAAGLLHLGDCIRAALPVLFGVLAVLALAGLLYAKCPPLRRKAEAFLQNHLGDRGIPREFNNGRFLQGLAMALGSGMALEEAMDLSAGLMEDSGSLRRCRGCAEAIQQGTGLAEALECYELLDKGSCMLLQVGIRSGSGEGLLGDIAEKKLLKAQEDLESAIGKIEPALVLASSVLVGLILLSVMLPLMDILSVLG